MNFENEYILNMNEGNTLELDIKKNGIWVVLI